MKKNTRTPDTGVHERYNGHSWIEVLYSREKLHRAVITRDQSDVYRVYNERRDDSDWEAWGTVLWAPMDKSLADTLDRARKIAREYLVATADGVAAEEDAS